MAPINRSSNNARVTLPVKKPMISSENNISCNILSSKRKAENSPLKNRRTKKPLNDLTNDGKTAKVKSIIKNSKTLSKIIEKGNENQTNTISVSPPVTRAKSVASGIRLPGPFTGNNVSSNFSINGEPLPSLTNVHKISSNIQKTKLITNNICRVKRASQIGQSIIKHSTICNSKHDKITEKLKFEKNTTLKENIRRYSKNISKDSLNKKSTTIEPEVCTINLHSVKSKIQETIKEDTEIKTEVTLRRSSRFISDKNNVSVQIAEKKGEENNCEIKPSRRSSTRLSLNKVNTTADKSTESGSLYISALEDITESSTEEKLEIKNQFYTLSEFDKELLHDPYQVSLYAMDIFEYLKSRESNFQIEDYMPRQTGIDAKMRAVLVDWMVEVQENFELNHETLYLSVKIVDAYLAKVKITKDLLQLVGAAALFLSCKYDERLFPPIDDFIFISDGACTHSDLLAMEQSILKHTNYELGFPISYSFLRRYARCARIQMPLLTLARFILELGLMDYSTITLSDSKQAAAALYLAFRMVNHSGWTDSLVYYTGYKLCDFKDIVLLFNKILHKKPSKELMTIRTKYSHKLFFKVAETPLLDDVDLDLDN